MSGLKKKGGGGGGHGGAWVITFADLVSLLMAFFVMLLSFSNQDHQKLFAVAGSMREAFGIQTVHESAGMIEREGNVKRDYLLALSSAPTQQDSQFAEVDKGKDMISGPEAHGAEMADLAGRGAMLNAAAESIRQAWRDNPDLTDFADNLVVERSRDGLDIMITDQQGAPMFTEGDRYPLETARKALATLAPVLAHLPNQIVIAGHAAAGGRAYTEDHDAWDLTAERANIARRILTEFGLPPEKISTVSGRGESQPLFPDDPYMAANERLTITVLDELPVMPNELKP